MKLSSSQADRLNTQHHTAAELCAGTTESRLHYSPAPGKWSMHDNIAHLSRYNVIFLDRIKTILAETRPAFPRYNADDDPGFGSWQQRPTKELIESISIERLQLIRLLQTISENDFERIGLHPKFGALTIFGWLEFYLLHEAHHLFTIFRLKHDTGVIA
jgi:hypothetical protein